MKTNKGTAAYARKTFVARLRRVLKQVEHLETRMVIQNLLQWLKEQQARFDKTPGGVGKY